MRIYASQYKQLCNNSPFNRWQLVNSFGRPVNVFNGALRCLLLSKELPISIYERHIVAEFKHFRIDGIERSTKNRISYKSIKSSTYIYYIYYMSSSILD